ARLASGPAPEPGFLLALVLIIAGLGFKVAAVPFHMWTPDVYEGAPTPVTAFLAVTSKTAGFALLLRLFAGALAPATADRAPFVALALTISLFSLAGMPLFAGFVTKSYLFTAAAGSGLLWLVGIAVVNSFISLYYYLLIIKQMYLYEPADPSRLRAPPAL